MRTVAEDHLVGHAEQQQPAGDLEGGDADPELAQEPVSDQRDHHQDRRRNQRRAQRDGAFGLVGHASGRGEESRRKAHGIDHEQQRHEGRQGEVDHVSVGSLDAGTMAGGLT
ncbi:hypothetical protein ACVWW2_006321 [Bradyrhizobium sp. LM4.3]